MREINQRGDLMSDRSDKISRRGFIKLAGQSGLLVLGFSSVINCNGKSTEVEEGIKKKIFDTVTANYMNLPGLSTTGVATGTVVYESMDKKEIIEGSNKSSVTVNLGEQADLGENTVGTRAFNITIIPDEGLSTTYNNVTIKGTQKRTATVTPNKGFDLENRIKEENLGNGIETWNQEKISLIFSDYSGPSLEKKHKDELYRVALDYAKNNDLVSEDITRKDETRNVADKPTGGEVVMFADNTVSGVANYETAGDGGVVGGKLYVDVGGIQDVSKIEDEFYDMLAVRNQNNMAGSKNGKVWHAHAANLKAMKVKDYNIDINGESQTGFPGKIEQLASVTVQVNYEFAGSDGMFGEDSFIKTTTVINSPQENFYNKELSSKTMIKK